MTQPKTSLHSFIRRFFKKLNAPYQLTIVDMDSMEESFSFHLTKKSVYLFLASVFVSIFILFSAIILFTPIKYYVPGMQHNISRKELFKLQNLSDSLIKINNLREGYVYNLLKVVNGEVNDARDTMLLSAQEIKTAESSNEQKIDKASRYDYLKNQKKDSLAPEKKDTVLSNKNQ